jgi:hypothetical protein
MAPRQELPAYLQEGFILAYGRKEANRFHAIAAVAAITAAAYIVYGYDLILAAALLSGCGAYYFFPFTERRPRLGVNQYGLFIDGLGLMAWRSIAEVNLVTYTMRTMDIEELQIKLKVPLGSALLADWRRLAIWRLLMRLPWSMGHDNIIRVKLQPFAPPPPEIHSAIMRLWRYYR